MFDHVHDGIEFVFFGSFFENSEAQVDSILS
jgi:hypothetical protein